MVVYSGYDGYDGYDGDRLPVMFNTNGIGKLFKKKIRFYFLSYIFIGGLHKSLRFHFKLKFENIIWHFIILNSENPSRKLEI